MSSFATVAAFARAIQVMEQQHGVRPSPANVRRARAAYLIRVALRRRINILRNTRRVNNFFRPVIPYREIGEYRYLFDN